jgi:hypothetical protein
MKITNWVAVLTLGISGFCKYPGSPAELAMQTEHNAANVRRLGRFFEGNVEGELRNSCEAGKSKFFKPLIFG